MTKDPFLNTIMQGHALEKLKLILSNSVDTCVTSPPYFGLRDYGTEPVEWPECEFKIFGFSKTIPAMKCSYGLEPTPEAFVAHTVLIFNEVHRVLKPTGTAWINFGDSYWGGKGMSGSASPEAQDKRNHLEKSLTKKHQQIGGFKEIRPTDKKHASIKPKDLVGIPWMVAFALREAGWYLRQDIIWAKPNPMPESITDRCTKSHEYIFLLSKSKNYYYDAEAIKLDALNPADDIRRMMQQKSANKSNPDEKVNGLRPREHKNLQDNGQTNHSFHKKRAAGEEWQNVNAKANKRSVWNVSTKPFSEAHFATFPEDLIVDCIKAGSSEHGCCSECGKPYEREFTKELIPGPKASYNSKPDHRDEVADKLDQGSNRMKDGHKPGWINITETTGWQPTCKCEAAVIPSVILDPFSGAGTTALVARKLNRNYIALELNPQYIKIANKRLKSELGMFL